MMKKLLISLVVFLLVLSITGCEIIQKANLGLKISKQMEPVEVVMDFFDDLTTTASTEGVQSASSYDYLADDITYTIIHKEDVSFTNVEELFEKGTIEYSKVEFENELNDNSSDLRNDWADVRFEGGKMEAIENLVDEHDLGNADWEDVEVVVLEELESILSSLVREKSAGGWVLEDQPVMYKDSWDFKYKTSIKVELNSNDKIDLLEVTFLEELNK